MINNMSNVISMFASNAAKGPTLISHVFDKELMAQVTVMEFEVSNKSTVPKDLPFGLLAEIINQGNINKARLRVRVGPGYFQDQLDWTESCVLEHPSDGELISVMVCTKVVPIGSEPEKGQGIWESLVRPIDDRHGLRITKKDPAIFSQLEYSVSKANVIPSKFLAQRGVEEISYVGLGTVQKPVLGVNDELKVERQVSPGAKQVIVRKLQETSTDELLGTLAYVEGTAGYSSSNLLDAEEAAPKGLHIVESKVEALGDGHFEKDVISVASWPVLRGSVLDDELNAPIGYTEQFVAPPVSTTNLKNVEYRPVNEDRTLRRELVVPTAAYEGFHNTYPVRANLTLPKVLKSVRVVWNASSSAGDQVSRWEGFSRGLSYSLSCNLSDRSSGSAGAIPEVMLEFEDIWATELPAQMHEVFLKMPITEAQLLAKFNAKRWPVFKPRSHTIVGIGQRVACSVHIAMSASSSGSQSSQSKDAGDSASTEVDVSLSNGVIQLPPCIHGDIQFQGELTKVVQAVATASMRVSGFNFPTLSNTKTVRVPATAQVFPKNFAAVKGATDIPRSGIYLIQSDVRPYKHGYARVRAILFDASNLAE